MAFAALLGAGAVMDAFVVAFRIPNLFREIFGEGAVSSAFVPVFAGEDRESGRKAAFHFFQSILTLLSLVLAAIKLLWVAAALLLPPEIYGSRAPREKVELMLTLAAMLFPYVLLVNVMALFMAVLNSLGSFFSPAIAPAVLNVFWIAGIAVAPALADAPEDQVKVVAGAILAGGVAQLLLQMPSLRRRGVPLAPRFRFRSPSVKRMLVLMVPMVVGLAPVQVNVFLDSIIAEACVPGDGANSWLNCANRLMQFPLALIGIALGIVVFPVFSRAAKAGDRTGLGKTLSESLGISTWLSMPAMAGLIALAAPLTALLFERGRFTAGDTAETAFVLSFYCLGLPFYCGLHILTRAFYSLEDARTPMKVGAIMVLVNLALNLTLVWPLRAAGLALATALTAGGNLLVLAIIARRRHRLRGLRGVLRGLLRSLALSAVMGAAVFLLSRFFLGAFSERSELHRLLRVFPPLLAGAGLYIGLSLLLRVPEARAVLPRLRRR
ncbi:MAG: murein biosynthesis integral membrane protein MurJ [Planctomycetes bacterium]|nr:murein biosynthesis integral membrane protein MurJ [Planctomycetota bacterium]